MEAANSKPKSKKPTPQERWGQLVNGRLSDKQLFDLFDDFGLAKRLQTKEDYTWVKHNLPNVPEELKKILKFEADKANNLRKEQEKARVNKVKEEEAANKVRLDAIKNNQQPIQQPEVPSSPYKKSFPPVSAPIPVVKNNQSTGMGGYPDGKGGPTDAPEPTGMQGFSATTSPNYSLIKFSLIKFTADPNGTDEGDATTVWLADFTTRTFKPIMSMQALQDLYPGDQNFQAAKNSITVVNPTELQTGGKLANFMDLGVDYGVYEGGVTKNLDFNPVDLNNAYGKTRNEKDTLAGVKAYDSYMKFLKSPDSGISNTFLDTIANDKNLSAFYINALGYGNYTLDDVYKDIKRRELISKGDNSLNGTSVISSNINKDQYVKTNAGRLADSLPSLIPPAQIGNISRDVWTSTAANLSDEYYNLINPGKYDQNSQEYKDNVEKIKTDMYDYVLQALETGKESDAIAADTKWQAYKADAEKLLGYKLSDSALAAWRQLEKLNLSEAEAGLSGSGLANEEQDKSLRDYREKDKREREATASTLTSQEALQARASYSPAQIQALIEEDKAKGLPMEQWRAYQWGLVPKDGSKTFNNFLVDYRTNYPDSKLSDEDIKGQIYDNLYDENGNIRSTLYQNYQNNVSKTKYGFDFNSIPATSQAGYKQDTYQQQLLDEEAAQQKDSLKAGDADYWNPLKGAEPINYQSPTPSDTTAVDQEQAKRVAEDKSNIAKAAAANAATAAAAKNMSSAPAGKTYIPNVESMKNYTNVTTPDANKKVYGVLKTSATPTTTATAAFTVKPGTSYIPNEAAMKDYANIYKDPNSKKLYGTLIKK